jgi:hypothetical protein
VEVNVADERDWKCKEYIGDSVYAEWDGYGVVLTTENGFRPTNRIYLEPGVVAALAKFIREAHDERCELRGRC